MSHDDANQEWSPPSPSGALPADVVVWNRAALSGGGSTPREGDIALSALLRAHSVVMNGGVFHATECLSRSELAAACAGYRYFGLLEAAELLELSAARGDEDKSGADDDEQQYDETYGRVAPERLIHARFRAHYEKNGELYASP